jgi:hypothetical protein
VAGAAVWSQGGSTGGTFWVVVAFRRSRPAMSLIVDSIIARTASASTPLLRPPALVKGDTIGVVAPSYSPREGWLLRGVKALERAGYQVILDPELMTLRRFQRKEDQRRAENFMSMWLDPRVKAVIGGTGGYGAVRMIPHLEPELFRLHPKSFVGYSDVTALHLWLNRLAGLRTFHGPTVDELVPGTRDATRSAGRSGPAAPRAASWVVTSRSCSSP